MGKRTLAVLTAVAGVMVAACSSRPQASPEELAAQAAKQYYDALAYGQPEQWVMGHAGADTLPAEYRQLLLENAHMFLAKQLRLHGGIADVAVADQRSQWTPYGPIAVLTLCFADATQETIAVPMTEEDGQWKIK